MTTAMYPGSFDPVTRGHLDIIRRASRMFDRLIVAVLNNSAKTPLFTAEERVQMLRECCADIPNVEVDSFDGLTVSFAEQRGATVMVRGLRAVMLCAPGPTLKTRSSSPTPTTRCCPALKRCSLPPRCSGAIFPPPL